MSFSQLTSGGRVSASSAPDPAGALTRRRERLAPLPDDEWDDRARASLAGLLPQKRRNVRGAGNALATLVRHPELAEPFLRFNAYLLLRSTLPPRLRELAVLRVAARRGCAYEWSHH